MVKDVFPGPGFGRTLNLTKFNDEIYFSATDGQNGLDLWKSDGTSEGTVSLCDDISENNLTSPRNLFVFRDKLYFVAADDHGFDRLWETNGIQHPILSCQEDDFIIARYPRFTFIDDCIFFIGSLNGSGFEILKYCPKANNIEPFNSFSTDLIIYPNPSNGQVFIQDLESEESTIFSLFNINGIKIFETKINSSLKSINLKDISPGIYIYKIVNGKNEHFGKLIKKN